MISTIAALIGRRAPIRIRGDNARFISAHRAWPEIAAAVALMISFATFQGMTLHHDVVWQLWIGNQMYHGAELYKDILELNPPLWFWVAVPIAAVADQFDVSINAVLIGFFAMAITLSFSLVGLLVREKSGPVRAATYASLFAASILALLGDFGQREHFTLIATVPYVAILNRRLEGLTVSWPLALVVGALAAVGLALKHYFALVPITLELYYLLRHQKPRLLFRPETLMLASGAALYAAAIVTLSPDFIRTMVPMVQLAYEGYDRPLPMLFLQWAFVTLFVSMIGFLLYGRPKSELARLAFLASAAFFAAYFLQHKGFRYQVVPAHGFLIIGIAAELQRALADWNKLAHKQRVGVSIFAPALTVPLALAFVSPGYHNVHRHFTEQAFEGLRPGQTVIALSANASTIWPMVEEGNLTFASRHFTFWMLPTIARRISEGTASPELRQLAHDVRTQTWEDLACLPPDAIFVDNHRNSISFKGVKFDAMQFFQIDPAFQSIFDSYQPGPQYGRLQVYRRVKPIDVEKPANCRPVHRNVLG